MKTEEFNVFLHGLEFKVIIHRNRNDQFRLVTKDGRIISTIITEFFEFSNGYKIQKLVWVLGFNVLKEYRSMGFGSKLFRFMLKYYRKKGYNHIVLSDGSKFSGTKESIYYKLGMRKNLKVWGINTSMYGNIRNMLYGVKYKPSRKINNISELIYPSHSRTRSMKRMEGGWEFLLSCKSYKDYKN